MYIIVAYDANPNERESIRAILMPQLHWIQNSVFAGELTKVAAKDMYDTLRSEVEEARITFWLLDKKPTTFHVGEQDDQESIFF